MWRWAGLVVVVAVACLVVARCSGRLEPDLSHDGWSYVDIAEHVAAGQGLPALDMRPPLYPLLLAQLLADDRNTALHDVVRLQRLAWVACAALVYLLVVAATARHGAALVAGLLFCTLSGPLFFVHLIYAETISMLALLAATWAFLLALDAQTAARAIALATVAALLAITAAYVRPILQLLPIVLGGLALLDRRRTLAARLAVAAPFATVVLVGLVPVYVSHAKARGGAFFVKTASYSLVNYLGDRRLLGRFPAEDRAIEDAYRRRFDAHPEEPLAAWWQMHDDWVAAARPVIGDDLDRLHLYMGAAARRVLRANVDYYLTRWRETWRELSAAVEQIADPERCPATAVVPLWRTVLPLVGSWLPFVVLVVELGRWAFAGRTASPVRLTSIVLYLAIGLASTAIEPWPGQGRYRAPIEPLLLVAAATAIAGPWRVRVRAALR